MSTLNIAAFNQVAVLGQLDLGISNSGIIEGQVSANNGATAINAGDAVKLDSAVTVVGAPQFLTALYSDGEAQGVIGYSVYQVKDSAVSTPDYIQVALFYRGPVMWLLAGATIAPGTAVEESAAAAGTVLAYGTSSSKLRGYALDYGATGQLMRVILAGGAGSLL
jgi:hypothetical protein